jgi:hypothetical protein
MLEIKKNSMILLNASNLRGTGVTQVALALIMELERKNIEYKILASGTVAKNLRLVRSFPYSRRVLTDFDVQSIWGVLKMHWILLKFHLELEVPLKVVTIFGPTYLFLYRSQTMGFAYPHLTYIKYLSFLSTPLTLRERIWNEYIRYNFNFFASRIVVETDDVKNKIVDRFSANIVVGPNSINPLLLNKQFAKNNPSVNKNSVINILCVSSNMPHKNLKFIDLICDELSRLEVRHVFHITISSKDGEAINFQSKNIIFTSRVNVSDLAKHYSTCDLTINPSLLECFSANLVESAYFNKWHVCNDLDFNKTEYKNVVRAEPQNEKDWAKLIIQCASKNLERLNIEKELMESQENRYDAYFL